MCHSDRPRSLRQGPGSLTATNCQVAARTQPVYSWLHQRCAPCCLHKTLNLLSKSTHKNTTYGSTDMNLPQPLQVPTGAQHPTQSQLSATKAAGHPVHHKLCSVYLYAWLSCYPAPSKHAPAPVHPSMMLCTQHPNNEVSPRGGHICRGTVPSAKQSRQPHKADKPNDLSAQHRHITAGARGSHAEHRQLPCEPTKVPY
jgi:hypothetical protein